MRVLGIETSCDETAAAIVSDDRQVHANVIHSQVTEHAPYGGVVPEVAARSHINYIEQVIDKALHAASVKLADIDAIAVTGGPGLIGGVIVGVMTAKALASVHQKPFIAVNHLEGHALTVRLTHNISFPYLLLLVSGGHCQFLIVHDVGQYTKLGSTVDDAVGEAFDKTAKMLGLPYPGGPQVEQLAKEGNPYTYEFPVPLKGRPGCDFSFSGLKTAVRKTILDIEKQSESLSDREKADICASFQRTVTESIIERSSYAINIFKLQYPAAESFVLAGGVAANQYIRKKLNDIVQNFSLTMVAPPIELCTDNAAMIAWAGVELFQKGKKTGFDFEPLARWPLA